MNMKSFCLSHQIFALIFYCLSGSTYAEEQPKVYQFNKYQLKLFSDGSGAFGLPEDLNVLGNPWHFISRKDEITDKRVVTTYRMALLPESKSSAGLGLYLSFSNPAAEYACVLGHDFPGRTAWVRVGKNPPVKTNNQGCFHLSKALDEQLSNASLVKIRGRKWPNDSDLTFDVNLDGYVHLAKHLRTVNLN